MERGNLELLLRSALGCCDDIAVGAQQSGERVLGGRLTVNEMHRQLARTATAYRGQPSLQLVAIGVGAVAVENLDARAERNVLSEDLQRWPSLDDPAAERVLGLEADDEDGVALIGAPCAR